MQSNGPTPADLNELLVRELERLVLHLFPRAVKQGAEYCVGSIHGEPGQSLRINVSKGPRRGFIRDFAAGEGYDAFKLAAVVQFGGDYSRCYKWAVSWLGLDNADPARIEQVRREARRDADQRAAEGAKLRAKERRKAEAVWLNARPLERGDVVDRYLLGRAIDLAELGRAPGALRFAPAHPFWRQVAADKFEQVGTFPAMVARIVGLDGRFIGTHQTWLKPDGSGKVGEAEIGRDWRGEVNKAKKVKAGYKTGHIKLWLGQHPDGRRVQGPLRAMKGERLFLSEGIEDGLTAAVADPSLAVACMINVGNISTIELPEQAREIVLLRQNDPPGSDAERAYLAGVHRLRCDGRRVMEVTVGAGDKDINDLAQRAAQRPLARAS